VSLTDEEQPGQGESGGYVKEMLGHQYSIYAALGSLLAGTALAFPFGFGVAALPVLAWAAGTSIAALFVPFSPGFRRKVDTRRARERRETLRKHLVAEISKRGGGSAQWAAYRRMGERVASLRKVAENRRMALTLSDVERLEDATVDFLSLWLANLAIHEREAAFDHRAVQRKLEQVNEELLRSPGVEERRRLESAKSNFEGVLRRREQMRTREAAAEAAMLSLADTFEEIYQAVMSNPKSTEVSRRLEEAVDRVRLQEQLESVLEDDLSSLLGQRSSRSEAAAQSANG
jgi:hypothetical protein